MTSATQTSATLFEDTFDSWRKATESAFKTQQEMYGKWGKLFPGMTPPEDGWNARMQKFQKDWAATVPELMQKHRDLVDQQYRAGIESLEEAFRVAGSEEPEELRAGCEAACRKAMDVMKQTSKQQMQLISEAMNKWVEVCQADS